MADNFGIYNLTAELEAAPSASIYGALAPPSGNINLRRKPERTLRDQQELDQAEESGVHVFVIPEVSSSQHELTSQNAYRSGTVQLEMTDVPASGNLYYSKRQRFISRTYAVTASAGLPITPSNEQSPATDEYAVRGTFNSFSGSYRNASIFNPSTIEIDVPDYGKIRDLKVWVEFIHDHRGGPGTGSFGGNPFLAGGTGATAQYPKQGLQGVQVALRSPNVDFRYAHPLWNNDTIKDFEKWPTSQVNASYRKVPELMKSSYLLWAGHSCEEDLGYALGSQTGSNPTYLPSSPYTIRDITSSSFGPGINFATAFDSSPAYTIFGYFPAFRTISTLPVVGTDMNVLYPTGTPTNPQLNTNVYAFIQDNGSTLNPVPQLFLTSSNGTAFGLTVGGGRLRKDRNGANIIHGACIWPGTGIAYGIRSIGDPNFNPWVHRFPCVTGDQQLGMHIPIGCDSFYDFALDTNNGAHFIANQWRGDLGISTLYYMQMAGPVTTQAYLPPGTTPSNAVPCFPFYTTFNSRTMTITGAGVTPGDNVSIPVTDVFNYVVGQTIRITSGATNEVTLIASIPDTTHIVVNTLANSYGAAGHLDMWGGNKLWTQSGSILVEGELDNPILNGGFDSSPAGSVGGYCQIEIDKTNMIHVVYTDTVNRSVKYAKKPVAYTTWSGSWSFELVHKHPAPATWPTHISLDIDGQNLPHVAYSLFDGVTDNLYYASSGSGGWNTVRVAQIPGIHLGTRMKLDSNGIPYIVTTITNFDGSGNEAVVIFASSSFVGWSKRNLYYNKTDNPRELSINFNTDNLIRVYSGGGRLTGMWETTAPQQGKYNEYNTDIDMRTIFTDSSRNLNPRDLSHLYASPSESAPNTSNIYGSLVVDGHVYPSPFSSSVRLLQTAGVWGAATSYIFDPTLDQANHLSGSNCPWFFDDRVPPGIFKGLNYFSTITSSLGLSPPPGWLSGPGGTAGVNQFPTTGSNLGPVDIRPVYPLMEDVYVEKILDQSYITANSNQLPSVHKQLIGFRPGLRGTEMHGKWKLLIGTAGDVSGGNVAGNPRAGVWFRQVRLEFLVDQGTGLKNTYPSKAYRFVKSGNPLRAGRRRLAIMSGSSAWDVGINYVFSDVKDEYGKSHGITDLTSSDKFAVFSQITGSLVGLLSESGGIYNVRQSYLNNEFGTPYIPISSGSGYIPSFDTFDVAESKESRDIFATTLNPKTLIPKDNTLKAHLTRANVLKTTRDVILSKVKLLK